MTDSDHSVSPAPSASSLFSESLISLKACSVATAGLCFVACGEARRSRAHCSVNCGQDGPAHLSHTATGSMSADLVQRCINVRLAARSVQLIDC